MSDKSKRMSLILDLVEKEVQTAASAFSNAQSRLAVDRLKLEEILSYLNGYANAQQGAGLRLTPEQLIRQRAFIHQLSQAQTQQRLIIAQSERDVEHKKSLWQMAHLKQRAMQDLVKRMADEELAKSDKLEAKLLDEWAQQQFVRRESQLKLH
jgi:flagellar FliJ protein